MVHRTDQHQFHKKITASVNVVTSKVCKHVEVGMVDLADTNEFLDAKQMY